MPIAEKAAEFPRLRSHPDRVYSRLRKAWTGTRREKPCTHLDQMRRVTPSSTQGCADCLALGDTWLHLRICLICGYVGCCDMAKNQHMLRHFRETGHMLIQSYEEGEDWIWCYLDEALLVPPEAAPGEPA
jgi:uncharacterized UBP type Zn finger protein